MRKTKNRSFNPDEIVIELRQALSLDFPVTGATPTQLYGSRCHSWRQLYASRQTFDFDKKYKSTVKTEGLADKAIADFIENNNRVGHLDLDLPYYNNRRGDLNQRDLILRRAKSLISEILGPLNTTEWFDACKHSNGVTVGVKYFDTSIEAKSTIPWTITSHCVPLMLSYFEYDNTLLDACLQRAGKPYNLLKLLNYVRGSRLTTVDKTSTEDRVIAPEPTANMFLQLGLMSIMYDRLKAFGLDVESLQDTHRGLARLASMYPSMLSTIDFSKASDSISLILFSWLFPADWVQAICTVRSTHTLYKGDEVELRMVSTMGNATTFPIETILFYALSVACVSIFDGSTSELVDYESKDQCSVYGDDVILPTDVAPLFMEIMSSLGFIPNYDKSFFSASCYFRESCGGDYFAGHNVRPFYIKAPTGTRISDLEPWLYIILNRLFKKYITYFGDDYVFFSSNLFEVIKSYFAKYGLTFKLVPPYFPDDSGFCVPDFSKKFMPDGIELSPISSDIHGTCKFNYCTYRYRDTQATDACLRLWQWLKFPPKCENSSQTSDTYKIKRGGGYVVSRGIASLYSESNKLRRCDLEMLKLILRNLSLVIS